MILALIAACAPNNVIGSGNRLPWRLPADMAWFVRHTSFKPIVVGRKTYESFGAKPLKNRRNIVVSRDANFKAPGADVVSSLASALDLVPEAPEVMVIGGAELYRLALPRSERLYLTQIHAEFSGDTYFPDYQSMDWREVFREAHSADAENSFAYTFLILEREV